MRQIELREHSLESAVRLQPGELELLRRAAPSMAITPSVISGRYDLRPRSVVGTVTLGPLRLRILPKLPIRRLLFLLAYSSDPKLWHHRLTCFGEADDLVEAIVHGFAYQVREILRGGLLQRYRTQEESLAGLRGRLRIGDQIRRHQGRFPPAEVRYDDFSEDILENQLLEAALSRLRRLDLRSVSLRRGLRALEQAFTNVSRINVPTDRLPKIRLTPLTRRYGPALELALRILRGTSFDLAGADIEARGFMVDMNSLFEEFVVTALRESLGLTERSFPQNARGRSLKLDAAGTLPLYPDLSWWQGSRCRFVGDVKYKLDRSGQGHRTDLYQILSYAIAADLPEGWLFYAAGPLTSSRHRILNAKKTLRVEALDLDVDPEGLLQQIARISSEIREANRYRQLPAASNLRLIEGPYE